MSFALSVRVCACLTAMVATAACGSSTSTGLGGYGLGDAGGSNGGYDATNGNNGGNGNNYSNPSGSSNGGGTSSGGGTACVAQCTQDSDCQNSCPPMANGVSCCDTTSMTCFGTMASACPSQPVGAE